MHTDPVEEDAKTCGTKRVGLLCPFCNRERWYIRLNFVVYQCKTVASFVTGLYTKGQCTSPHLTQWGPL